MIGFFMNTRHMMSIFTNYDQEQEKVDSFDTFELSHLNL